MHIHGASEISPMRISLKKMHIASTSRASCVKFFASESFPNVAGLWRGDVMSYVDGFVLAVPKKKIQAYKKMASLGRKIWREHGALDYKECQGDDLNVKFGLPCPKAFKSKPGEVVFFSFIVY